MQVKLNERVLEFKLIQYKLHVHILDFELTITNYIQDYTFDFTLIDCSNR